MANQVLGSLAVEEIREAMYGLRGPLAKDEAERLAKFYDISASRVYDITRDLRPRRKRRTDTGSRTADLLEHDGLRYAAELVVLEKVEAKRALERVKREGYDIPVSLGTFRRYLREHQISPTQLKRKR
jgi:hypothetical protein